MRDHVNDLDALTMEVREQLNSWLALRKLERRGSLKLSVCDDDLGSRLLALLVSGEVVKSPVRHRLLWTCEAYQLSDAGRRALESKRTELEHLQEEIGAIATGGEALADRGIIPGVFLLERMVLLHRRFDDEDSGFFTRCQRLAAHVRGFSATTHGRSDAADMLALWAFGHSQ